MLPTDKQSRKERPIASGVLAYFPDAIAEVAHGSFIGNQQHNPGQPMHWARHKSTDHSDCVARHLTEQGKLDDDGLRHTAKAAWRALALLQLEIEADASKARDQKYDDQLERDIARAYAPIANGETVECSNHTSKGVPIPPGTTFNGYPIQYVAQLDEETYVLPETVALNNWLYDREPRQYETATEAAKRIGFAEARVEQAQQAYGYRKMRVGNEIYHLGCKSKVADQIALGTTFHGDPTLKDKYVYIAGPMRGYPAFNFPAFDGARDAALRNGWIVISPADIDRHAGIKEDEHKTGDATPFDQRTFVYRDFFALYFIAHTEGGAIAMLPGWEKSTGAVAEFFLARWLGLKVLDARTGKNLKCYDNEAGVRGFSHHDLIDTVRTFLAIQEK